MATKSTKAVRHRSSITGHFVTKATADRHPKTTETERVSKPKPKKR